YTKSMPAKVSPVPFVNFRADSPVVTMTNVRLWQRRSGSLLICLRRTSRALALGVLRRLASALEAGLLALLDPRVAREQPGLAQRSALSLVEGKQRSANAVGEGVGPRSDSATADPGMHVERIN